MTAKDPDILPLDLIKEVYYDPETGVFTRNRGCPASRHGEVIGWQNGVRGGRHKHLVAGLFGRKIMLHRLAWFYCYGRWPQGIIDHINGDHTDNRIANLREATPAQNTWNSGARANSRLGVKGVHYVRHARKYRARIEINGKSVHLGYYLSISAAKSAYDAAALIHHGEFARL